MRRRKPLAVTTYAWDHRNRLTRVTDYDVYGDAAVRAVDYDVENRWIGRDVDLGADGQIDSRTRFAYDGNQIVLQFDGADMDAPAEPLSVENLSHRYLWNPAAVDQLMADEHVTDPAAAGDVLWPLADHLGTIRDLAAHDPATGATSVVNHRTFDAYGNLLSQTNPAHDTLFAFTARPLDQETALQNNLHRWYDAAVGRWMSEDPIGFEGRDGNLSAYVGNSPVNATDPAGKATTGGVMVVFFWEPHKYKHEYTRLVAPPMFQACAREFDAILKLMISLGGPVGDAAWAFYSRDTAPNGQQYRVLWASSHFGAASERAPGSTLRLISSPNFLQPVVDKNRNWIIPNGDDDGARFADRFIVMAHELGHLILGCRDPEADSHHMGASVAFENLARHYLELFVLANRPMREKAGGMRFEVNVRDQYTGNVDPPKSFGELRTRIALKGPTTRAGRVGQSELEALEQFTQNIQVPDWLKQERAAFLKNILESARQRLQWAATPDHRSSIRERQQQMNIGLLIVQKFQQLYPGQLQDEIRELLEFAHGNEHLTRLRRIRR